MKKMETALLVTLTLMLLVGWAVWSVAIAQNPGAFGANLDTASVRVKDGDTFVLNGTTVRLAYVDTPERDQPFHSESTKLLAEMLDNGSKISCVKVGMSYDRVVAQCNVDKEDIGYRLVREGLAFRDPRYSSVTSAPLLVYAQTLAMVNGRGAWSKPPVEFPWDASSRKR